MTPGSQKQWCIQPLSEEMGQSNVSTLLRQVLKRTYLSRDPPFCSVPSTHSPPAVAFQPESNHTAEEAGVQHLALQWVRDLSAATGRQKEKELGYKGKNVSSGTK